MEQPRVLFFTVISVEVLVILSLLPLEMPGQHFSMTGTCEPGMIDRSPGLDYPHQEPRTGYFQSPVQSRNETLRIRYNRFGIRDENFSSRKPQDVYRIVAVGDSFTFGHGVDESERFTEILEKQLNRKYDRKIQVINAGQSGMGMKDFYQMTRKMSRHNPDLVLVSFYNLDELSYNKMNELGESVKDDYGISSDRGLMKNEEAREEFSEKVNEKMRERLWDNSSIIKYGNAIQQLGEEKDFETVFFHIKREPETLKSVFPKSRELRDIEKKLGNWTSSCGYRYLPPPDRFRNSHSYTYPNDGHYNETGNLLMADYLSEKLPVNTAGIKK